MTLPLARGRTLAIIAVIAVSTAAAGSSANLAEDLIGRWKGDLAENGTRTSVTIDFFPSGTYARRVELSSEFGWTLEGDILLIAPAVERRDSEVEYGKASAVKMKLDRDMLMISDARQTISMKRVTVPINESALLGRWEGQSDLNEGITQDFLSDGRLIVTVTLAREAGRYSVDKNTIHFEEQIPVAQKRKSKFRLEDGKLVLYLSPELPAMELARISQAPGSH